MCVCVCVCVCPGELCAVLCATEGVDFRVGPGRMDFFEVPGNQTRCVCVQIIDDSCFRGNRYFNLFLFCDKDSVRTSTKPVFVTIMDDEENGE